MSKETLPPEDSTDTLKTKLAVHFKIPTSDIFTHREYPNGKVAIITVRAEKLEVNKNELV